MGKGPGDAGPGDAHPSCQFGPVLDHAIVQQALPFGRNLRGGGLTLARMGLGGLGKDEFLDILENGFTD